MTDNYSPTHRDQYIQHEDLVKIIAALQQHNSMNENLKNAIVTYIQDHADSIHYVLHAELAVLFASRLDETYRKMYFKQLKPKFLRELKHLDDETLYKIIWSLIKADELEMTDADPQWKLIKDDLTHKSKELSPKILSDLILLSTKSSESTTFDLFSALENDIILKLRNMSLDELIQIFWASLTVERGGKLFYEQLEAELTKRIRGIRDEQFETLIACFSGDKADSI